VGVVSWDVMGLAWLGRLEVRVKQKKGGRQVLDTYLYGDIRPHMTTLRIQSLLPRLKR
jgi:hypothetical protein